MVKLREGDVLAVRLPPGPRWLDVLATTWDARAALLPLDVRLPGTQTASILQRGRPTTLIDDDGVRRLPDGEPSDGSLALFMPTSGTTADPKLAELTYDAVRAQVAASNAALGASASDPWLCCLPLAHIGGLLVALRSVAAGTPVRVHERFEPASVEGEDAARYVSVVPTMLYRLLEAGADLARFDAMLVGGASLDASLAKRAHAAGARVVATYGMTETCGGVVYDGRPLPGVDVRVAGDQEIHLRTPSAMRGYRASGVDPFTDDGWLRTRDAGVLAPDGRLRILGHLDEVIVTGGEKVWPGQVEAALRLHPSVEDAIVVGVPDPEWGQRVVALVVGEGADVLGHLRAALPRYAVPRAIVRVDEIPRTPSGKPSRGLALDLAHRSVNSQRSD